MYEEYWGLNKAPFDNVPDPNFFFYSEGHEEALMRLLYAIERGKGAALLTGDVGCGKTLISRSLVRQLEESDEYQIALITNPNTDLLDFLSDILHKMGIEKKKTNGSKVQLTHLLDAEMMNNAETGRNTLIIVDEAHLIEDEKTLEELRLLLNFQLNEKFLLTLVLIGQQELRKKIAHLSPLDQRIAIRCHLHPLNYDDTIHYIVHRLKKAGLGKNIFKEDAMEKIYDHTKGIPRMINTVCDLSLLAGVSTESEEIDSDIVQCVIDEM
ncbi:MAG: AAA family ATPase [Thermodesulfobacteriota bacterium]|nr:AAA family ATPase [Thermodesulfobacteriota bacterium]